MTRRSETEILETVYRRSAQITLRRRILQISVGVVALVLVLTTSPALVRQLAFQEVDTAGQPGAEDSRKDGTEHGDIEGTEVGPRSDGPFAPGSSDGGQGSSSKSGSGSGSPEGTIPQDSETTGGAGPPVFYTDQTDDAYYGANDQPNAELSQREFDILRVDWAPASHGYSTSITVAGPARSDGEYISEGQFDPARTPPEGCWLAHFLTPGTTAHANAFCQGRFVARMEGSPVVSTQTTSGGTRLTATFDNRAIPQEFETARTLHNLAAVACPPSSCEGQFLVSRWVDYARAPSWLTYRV